MKKLGIGCLIGISVLFILCVFGVNIFALLAKPHKSDPEYTCISNERCLGLAVMQYVQDNDDNLPNIADAKDPKTTWRSMIHPYAQRADFYQCPSREDKLNGPDGLSDSYAANYTGNYSGSVKDWGQGAFAGPGSKNITLADLNMPAELIMLCEVSHSDQPDFNIDNLGRFNPDSNMLWAGHTQGGNYAFADGHAKWLKPMDTKVFWHRDVSVPLSAGAMDVLKNAHLENEKLIDRD